MDKNLVTRRDTHDFFKPDHVAEFLRNHKTGVDNLGRQTLGQIVGSYGEGTTVLDGACGTGVNYEVFLRMKVPAKYMGMDRTKQFIEFARKAYPDADFIEGYVQETKFYDGEFDVVILRHILEHLPDGYEAAIREAVRVAKKEAILVFFLTPSGELDDDIKEEGPDERGCMYFWNTYSLSKLMKFLTTLGVEISSATVETPGAAHSDKIIRLIK